MSVVRPFDDVELAEALAAPPGWSRQAASDILGRAQRIGTDPIEVMAALDPTDREGPYRRAASFLGVPHRSEIATFLSQFDTDLEADRLGGLRSVRGSIAGHEVLFLAPGFAHLRGLAARIKQDENLRRKLCIVSPATLDAAIAQTNPEPLTANALQRLARRFPIASAHLDLPLGVRLGFVTSMVALTALATMPAFLNLSPILAVMALILGIPSAFRMWAAFTFERNSPLRPDTLLNDRDLPVYSVLIPLRDEAHMVAQIARAMQALDYPAEKLDIKFVVESASPRTVRAARKHLGDRRFSLIVVPRCRPYTKPKALNFALPLARGEHVVVFDAEDLPDPGQLRTAASLFATDVTLECLQGELVIANGSRNWITRMFAAEYAGHFGVLLPAIGRAGFPVPLGGTSNHFRTATLKNIGAWDAFNVTEDADLGIRMARLGLRVESLETVTLEEAPETVMAWVRQRSRWIKGWMQTLLVHSARPGRLLADLGWANLAAFYIFVGGMVLSFSVHGVFLISTVTTLLYGLITTGSADMSTAAGLGTLLFGYAGAIVVSILGLDRIGRKDIAPWLIVLPAYWLMAWCAVMLAAFELVIRPYHWSKTKHKGVDPAQPKPTPRPAGSSHTQTTQ
ncbi:glycosyltransferase [Pelagibacterium halotolerans]|uniref:Putative glycosyl transferase n=1 Tax=Pelagibacterium halotolerans (strain DSM 22347 / JCM 15775 / CGMCC 1.7692 / B2) TaxID=1082931 RepID=G4R9I8_PELHB|nr:glycosyltransferase [Pelagibacterium halotolerans]AEQ50408.1 putative glycosyl transferase [Pelagibacterium halotolerans B2]QJR19619.1 glycosyltransferase [Pelagibacterium halotolerans]SDZ86463.1 Glycosyltransferase, catalytic subunit of cellulose synthase and poly-beta-1,6-N-acetylglucosamine synthase [Pelagibacterium halotolerans]